jgi:hypothetical protein
MTYTGQKVTTGRQIAAALALLDWSKMDLAQRAGVSVSTVQRAVLAGPHVPRIYINNLELIERALSERVRFLDAGRAGGVGVRLKRSAGER